MDRTLRGGAIIAGILGVLMLNLVRADDKDKDPLREKALKLNDITGKTPMTGELRTLVRDEAGTKKLIATALKMSMEKPQPFNYTGAYILARAAHILKEFEAAKTFYKIASDDAFNLQSANKIVDVYDGLIELYIENKKFDDAVKTCQEFLKIDNDDRDNPINKAKPFVMERMIQAKAKEGKTAEALKLTEELIKADEDGWYFIRLKGEVLREAEKYNEAAKAYEEALDHLKKDKRIEDEEQRDRFGRSIRYALSGIYVDLNKVDKAAEQLEALRKAFPENATFMNDLGFIWADHDMKLDESEKLIRQALEQDRKDRKKIPGLTPEEDKDNAAYLDSLGWVLFKKKDYKEAKKYLQEAVKQKEGQHIEIMDHLADVQMALGEKKEAIKTWEDALKKEDLSKREKERRKMIESKLNKAKGESEKKK